MNPESFIGADQNPKPDLFGLVCECQQQLLYWRFFVQQNFDFVQLRGSCSICFVHLRLMRLIDVVCHQLDAGSDPVFEA